MAWWYVVFAGILEVIWVLGLRYSSNLWQWTGTIVLLILTFYFIIKACEYLPSGTVYAVFTGMGATAIAIIDILITGEFSIIRILLIALIIAGVVGLRLSDTEEAKQKGEGVH